jgi:hypothetical protein
VTGTGANGCPAANTVVTTVSVSNNPTVAINAPTLICLGASPLITGSGAVTYSWSNGSTQSGVIVQPTTNTTYTLWGFFGTCTSTAVHQMSVSPNPTLTAQSFPSVVCIGNTATLSAFGASTYTWSTGQVGLTATVSPTVETTYTLIGAINGMCQQEITITQSVVNCAGVDEINGSLHEMIVFPNPASGEVKIMFSALGERTTVEIYHITGQMILSEDIHRTVTGLDLKALPRGVYFIRVKENGVPVKSVRLILE